MLLAAVFAVPGCSDDAGSATSGNATTPGPIPGVSSGSTGSSSSGGGGVGPVSCEVSDPDADVPCHCAADHHAGTTAPPATGICRDACVPDGFVPYWCLDDAACCSGACDVATGYCGGPPSTSGVTTTGGVTSGGPATGGASGDTGTAGP